MFERLSDRASRIMALANGQARRYGHEHLGTEHLLLALVEEGSGVAVRVMTSLGVESDRVVQEIERRLEPGPAEVPAITGQLPATQLTRRVIEYAIEQARALHHDFVGTEHLLLGLVREEEGMAGQVLKALGLNLSLVREHVLEVCGSELESLVDDASRGASHPIVRRYRELIDALVNERRERHKCGETKHALELNGCAETLGRQLTSLSDWLEPGR
ncbi:MAG: Clp protease N-terminal domain-containing protein [Planctomycetota bacterium]|jgi:ATP-dependent Clp protease ATP-binding subunit ClpC